MYDFQRSKEDVTLGPGGPECYVQSDSYEHLPFNPLRAIENAWPIIWQILIILTHFNKLIFSTVR